MQVLDLIIIFIFATGISVGSFLNVVGLRVPNKQSIISPGSACPKCNYQLKPLDLIPIFSYIFLRGKCKGCNDKIKILYPIMELLTGLSFVILYLNSSSLEEFLFASLLISVMISLTMSDLVYRLVPNVILFYSFIILVPYGLYISENSLLNHFVGGLVIFISLLLVALATKGGMGGGDIKLLSLLGLALGIKAILLIFMIACFVGAIIGLLIKVVDKGVKTLPFVPFIFVGVFITLIYDDALWNLLFNR